jgi:hypothetical protein
METKCYGFATRGLIARLKIFDALLHAAICILFTGQAIIEIKDVATTPNVES